MINTLRAIETEFSVIGWKGLSYTVDHVSPYSRRHSFLSIHFLHLVAPFFSGVKSWSGGEMLEKLSWNRS